jgi:hypothetical protein
MLSAHHLYLFGIIRQHLNICSHDAIMDAKDVLSVVLHLQHVPSILINRLSRRSVLVGYVFFCSMDPIQRQVTYIRMFAQLFDRDLLHKPG